MRKICIFLLLALLCMHAVLADLGPKPSMAFTVRYQIPAVDILGGAQLECGDALCTNSTMLAAYGPQGFRCYGNSCSSMAYGYRSKFHNLIINFSDRNRESNVFSTSAFDARFNVNVLEDGLVVVETTGDQIMHTVWLFLIALVLTITLELATAGLYFLLAKIPLYNLRFVVLVNLITLPVMWLGLIVIQSLHPLLAMVLFPLLYLISSLLAIVAEGLLIYFFSKQEIGIARCYVLSTIMNLVSLFLGGIILLFISAAIP